MKFHTLLFGALFFTVLLACGSETSPDTTDEAMTTPTEEPAAGTLDEFRVQLADLTLDYLDIKDALVQSDLAAVTSAGATFGNGFNEIDAADLNGLDRGDWERLSADIRDHGKSIAGATDLEMARKQFSLLSPALIEALKRFNANEAELYVQYCPMAFDNAGATWLSANEEIRNPYFGDAMLTCGKIQEELAAN
jgi:Cu(I)/Ag(I) efflux system membrane fusion protein